MFQEEQLIQMDQNNDQNASYLGPSFIINKDQFKDAVTDSIVDAFIRIMIPALAALFTWAVIVFIYRSRN